jgi:hypothetical protein
LCEPCRIERYDTARAPSCSGNDDGCLVPLDFGRKLSGGRFASLYESLPLPSLFEYVALMALVAAIVLAILVGPIKRLMVASEQAPC